jgi:hypothetical protein
MQVVTPYGGDHLGLEVARRTKASAFWDGRNFRIDEHANDSDRICVAEPQVAKLAVKSLAIRSHVRLVS